MQMYAPPGVNAVTSATTGQPYAVAPGGAINALVADVPDLLSRGFTLQRVSTVLAQSGVPVILPSSGTSNASGQITLGTALPYQPVGTVQVYLPAGVVTGGSQGSGAGLYSATFSSATVCQLTGTGITTANAAYTQTLGFVNLASVVVPGGAMGPNGMLRVGPQIVMTNNANSKMFTVSFGGTSLAAWTVGAETMDTRDVRIRNRGVTNAQTSSNWTGYGGSTAALGSSTVDTSVSQTLTIAAALAVATDNVIVEGYTVEVLPG